VAERTIDQIVAECERWWRSTGVPAEAVGEMGAELRSHLVEGDHEGKSLEDVVGTDLAAFAEEWAAEFRPAVVLPPRREAPLPSTTTGGSAKGTWIAIGVITIAFLAIVILAPKEDTVDTDSWQWIWVGAAVILAIGELLTAGFFLLPFAVGAAAAAILAFLGVSPVVQLLVFSAVSIAFLVLLQKFARREDEVELQAVGSKRYAGKTAIVHVPVNRLTGSGMVRMDAEEWRATTDLDTEIPAGTEVRVVEIRGTRLVVEPIRPGAPR
jgi:membrane protein implicated in regulation of membrane protease activity